MFIQRQTKHKASRFKLSKEHQKKLYLLRMRFPRWFPFAIESPKPSIDNYTETWTPAERLAFVDRWCSWVNEPDNPQRHYYPNPQDTAAQQAWTREFAPHVDMPPDRIERGRNLLLNYPSHRMETIKSISKQLRKEHAGRFSAQIRRGLTQFNEQDSYVLDLNDEGYILGDIPWAVLRYDLTGDVFNRSAYLEMKQIVIDADPRTRDEVYCCVNGMLEENHLRTLTYLGLPDLLIPEVEDKWFRNNNNDQERLFDLTYPERVKVDRGVIRRERPGPDIGYVAEWRRAAMTRVRLPDD